MSDSDRPRVPEELAREWLTAYAIQEQLPYPSIRQVESLAGVIECALEAARRERDDIEKAMQKQAVAYWSTPAGKRCIELGAEADRFRDRADAAEAKLAAVEAGNKQLAEMVRVMKELFAIERTRAEQAEAENVRLRTALLDYDAALANQNRVTGLIPDALERWRRHDAIVRTSREPSPPPDLSQIVKESNIATRAVRAAEIEGEPR